MIYCHLVLYKDFDKKIEKKFNSAKLAAIGALIQWLQSSANFYSRAGRRSRNPAK